MTVQEKYDYLKSLVNSERSESFLKLLDYAEKNLGYMKAPCSTKYHLSREGGLLEHSISVAMTMIKFKRAVTKDITDEQCIIVGLLHDLGKCGVEGKPQYIMKEPTPKQIQYGYPGSIVFNEDILFMEHEDRSLYLIQKLQTITGFVLTEEEWGAIKYHNEPWNGQHSAFRKNRLMTLLQYADYYSCLYLEDQ